MHKAYSTSAPPPQCPALGSQTPHRAPRNLGTELAGDSSTCSKRYVYVRTGSLKLSWNRGKEPHASASSSAMTCSSLLSALINPTSEMNCTASVSVTAERNPLSNLSQSRLEELKAKKVKSSFPPLKVFKSAHTYNTQWQVDSTQP